MNLFPVTGADVLSPEGSEERVKFHAGFVITMTPNGKLRTYFHMSCLSEKCDVPDHSYCPPLGDDYIKTFKSACSGLVDMGMGLTHKDEIESAIKRFFKDIQPDES